MSKKPVEICEYSANWAAEFHEIGLELRQALADTAIRIDHIGSTAVQGLAAKPVIDVQISVLNLTPTEPFLVPIESLGYVWRRENLELTKRYFREKAGSRRTHIHVRNSGSWHEQKNLLFRDYLRSNQEARAMYERSKRNFANEFVNNRDKYLIAKRPVIWAILNKADAWAAKSGWRASPTDL